MWGASPQRYTYVACGVLLLSWRFGAAANATDENLDTVAGRHVLQCGGSCDAGVSPRTTALSLLDRVQGM
eukprot:3171920-Amphidinium_carterae.1